MVIGAGVYCIFGRAYLLLDMADNVTVIWNEDDAFLLVGTFTAGINERVWKVEAASLLNAWGIGGFAQRFHEDLTVFHIRGKTLEKYYLKDFGYGGWGYPFHGELYVYGGSGTMRFTGTNFIPVSKSEVFTIQNQFPPEGNVEHSIAEQLKKEGWKSNDSMVFGYKNAPCSVPLRDQHLILTVREDEAYSPQWVMLEGWLDNAAKETLFYNGNCHYRWVSETTYTKAKAK